MKIETNLPQETHDSIRFPTIEKQVYDLLALQFNPLTHKMGTGGFVVEIPNKLQLAITVKQQNVRLEIIRPMRDEQPSFGEGKYPGFNLKYNTNLTKKIIRITDTINKIYDLQERAKKLPHPPSNQTITAALDNQLATDTLQTAFWNDNLFTGVEITFHIHPRGKPPGDGLVLAINKDNTLAPFWNSSTKRRTLHYNWNGTPVGGEPLEKALGHYDNDINSLKRKVKDMEELENKIRAFDPTKDITLTQLVELKKRADALVEEFSKLVKS